MAGRLSAGVDVWGDLCIRLSFKDMKPGAASILTNSLYTGFIH